MVDLIRKKKEGISHTREEIEWIIRGYTDGSIPDYQMAAWLMAVCFKGLDDTETAFLTHAMVHSGDVIDLSGIPGIKVDKHSTGGVGDKTTLVLAPLVACEGVPVAKMSGRGLGHTGGTLDKLESIPGFNVNLTASQFVDQVKKIGLAVCAQSGSLVPADKKMYALRDVTSTVDNISLIAASIMSKKLASGADAMVIDIKTGEGAFMKSLAQAEKLASIMQSTARQMNKQLIAVVTAMDQPLGNEIGNLLEVKEAVQTLQGQGPEDLTDVCLTLGSYMLTLHGKYTNIDDARNILARHLKDGTAYAKFIEFVKAQGGDLHTLETITETRAPYQMNFTAKRSGYITDVKAMETGKASMYLGAGRETKEDTIDMLAGITLIKKYGDYVKEGDTLAVLHTSDNQTFTKAAVELEKAFEFSEIKPDNQPLIIKVFL